MDLKDFKAFLMSGSMKDLRQINSNSTGVLKQKLIDNTISIRQTLRTSNMNKFRKIPENLSAFNTPQTERKSSVSTTKLNTRPMNVTNMFEDKRNARMERLRQYRENKEKHKREEAASKKPLFKVTHVVAEKFDLGTVYSTLKGRKINNNTIFFPNTTAHKFTAPSNVKQFDFMATKRPSSVIKRVTRSMKPVMSPVPDLPTRRTRKLVRQNAVDLTSPEKLKTIATKRSPRVKLFQSKSVSHDSQVNEEPERRLSVHDLVDCFESKTPKKDAATVITKRITRVKSTSTIVSSKNNNDIFAKPIESDLKIKTGKNNDSKASQKYLTVQLSRIKLTSTGSDVESSENKTNFNKNPRELEDNCVQSTFKTRNQNNGLEKSRTQSESALSQRVSKSTKAQEIPTKKMKNVSQSQSTKEIAKPSKSIQKELVKTSKPIHKEPTLSSKPVEVEPKPYTSKTVEIVKQQTPKRNRAICNPDITIKIPVKFTDISDTTDEKIKSEETTSMNPSPSGFLKRSSRYNLTQSDSPKKPDLDQTPSKKSKVFESDSKLILTPKAKTPSKTPREKFVDSPKHKNSAVTPKAKTPMKAMSVDSPKLQNFAVTPKTKTPMKAKTVDSSMRQNPAVTPKAKNPMKAMSVDFPKLLNSALTPKAKTPMGAKTVDSPKLQDSAFKSSSRSKTIDTDLKKQTTLTKTPKAKFVDSQTLSMSVTKSVSKSKSRTPRKLPETQTIDTDLKKQTTVTKTPKAKSVDSQTLSMSVTKSVSKSKIPRIADELMTSTKTPMKTRKSVAAALTNDSESKSVSKSTPRNVPEEQEKEADMLNVTVDLTDRKVFNDKTPENTKEFFPNSMKTPVPSVGCRDVDSAVVYISPFVTISRGKVRARDEFTQRKSSGGTCVSPGYANSTGVQAGAEYFTMLLNKECNKINEQCDNWNTFKTDNNLPEEAIDMINLAVGQGTLLRNKKMQQFRDLIQSSLEENCERPVTCMDLHGFWDMINMQVENVHTRFENLTKLRDNNWEEILPVKQFIPKKPAARRPHLKRSAKATSTLRDAIKAARLRSQVSESVSSGSAKSPRTPRKNSSSTKTPNSNRKSILKSDSLRASTRRVSLLNGTSENGQGSPKCVSPFIMMQISHVAKSVERLGKEATPTRSILKSRNLSTTTSNKKTKTVLFKNDDDVDADEVKENDPKVQIEDIGILRRSPRVLLNKLF